MIRIQIIRCISTRSIVDKWFNAIESKTHEEQQAKLGQCIEYSLQQEQWIYSNLIRDIIHRWVIQQPKREALWAYEIDSNNYQKLTFNNIYTQSSRLADVLTGNHFNLTAGKSVLVILPSSTKERILIQFACLQSGLIFYFHDPKYLIEQTIRQQIRTSAIDCIITDVDNLELITKCTHNSLRPLKKCLMTDHIRSEPLPVGWHYLMHSINTVEKEDWKIDFPKRVLRHLSTDKPVNYYPPALFSIRQMLIAYWLNMHKTPRIIWLKEDTAGISFAPWLLGSTIFYKDIDNVETMFKTFKNNPIDTFCASENDYQMLDKQQQQNNTHLEQLLSTEPINDPMIKPRWYSLTNLHIRDNSLAQLADLKNRSVLKYKQFDRNDQQRIQVKQFESF